MSHSTVTIATNEDMETGFMLADEAAPKTPEERERVFAELADVEWGVTYDPAEIAHRFSDARPYKLGDDEESMIESTPEDADEWWFVFELPDDPLVFRGGGS